MCIFHSTITSMKKQYQYQFAYYILVQYTTFGCIWAFRFTLVRFSWNNLNLVIVNNNNTICINININIINNNNTICSYHLYLVIGNTSSNLETRKTIN